MMLNNIFYELRARSFKTNDEITKAVKKVTTLHGITIYFTDRYYLNLCKYHIEELKKHGYSKSNYDLLIGKEITFKKSFKEYNSDNKIMFFSGLIIIKIE